MNLTKRAIEGLKVTGERYEVRDDTLKGFVVRVGAKGDKAFYYVYRPGKGRGFSIKRYHIGNFPSMTVEQARIIAKHLLVQVATGHDPANEVREAKSAPTMKEAFTHFFNEHGSQIKPNTLRTYRQIARDHILPSLGKVRVEDVQYRDISKLHLTMKETPYQANRCIAVLSKFFNWCEKVGYRKQKSNPVEGIEKYKEQRRERFMERNEMQAIGNAFAIMEAHGCIDPDSGRHTNLDPIVAAAIKMLLFTGARCMEILTLRWEDVDLEHGIAYLPDSKTGAKTIQLPLPAIAILEGLPHLNEFCFPGRYGKGHIVNIKDTWKRLLHVAGLEGWRIHDLRHAFASYAVNSGKTLPVIGKLLGHSQAATTARYAHLADNPVRQAAEETASAIMKDFAGN